MNIRISIVLVLFMFLLSVVSAYSQSAAALIKSGEEKLNQNDFAGAIADFSKAITTDKNSAQAFILRSEAKLRSDDFDGAIADYDTAVSLNPKLGEVEVLADIPIHDVSMENYNSAKTACQNGREEKALSLLAVAVEKDPTNYQAFELRGDIYRGRLEYRKAAEDYTKAIAILKSSNPFFLDINFLNKRGYCFLQLFEYRLALKDFNRGIFMAHQLHTEGSVPDIFLNRGRVQQTLGKYKNSITDFSRAVENAFRLERNDILGVAYNERGVSYLLSADPDNARKDFMAACAMGVSSACDNYKRFFPEK